MRSESKRLSKRDLLEKLQGKPLLIAKADLPEQLYCWGEGFVRMSDPMLPHAPSGRLSSVDPTKGREISCTGIQRADA